MDRSGVQLPSFELTKNLLFRTLVEAELVAGTARGDWTVTPEVHPPLSANHLSITPELMDLE
nr:hypothetical protein Iba_chr12fCG3390 [Ipomoea batatas]